MNDVNDDQPSLMDVLFDLASEVVASRIRVRALLEILEERGVIDAEEFDRRGQIIWDRDWREVANEVAPLVLKPDEG